MFSQQQWLAPLILLFPLEIFFKLVLLLAQIKWLKRKQVYPSEIISNKLNEDIIKKKNENNIDESLLILVDLNIKKTREIIKNDQSRSLDYNNTN